MVGVIGASVNDSAQDEPVPADRAEREAWLQNRQGTPVSTPSSLDAVNLQIQ